MNFDGTLVDIAKTPDQILVCKKTISLLAKLNKTLNSAVAIVTERQVSQIDKFLNPVCLPIAGKHGAETSNEKQNITTITSVNFEVIVEQLASFANIHAETFVENKGACVDLHFRGSNVADQDVQAWVEHNIHLGTNLRCIFGK